MISFWSGLYLQLRTLASLSDQRVTYSLKNKSSTCVLSLYGVNYDFPRYYLSIKAFLLEETLRLRLHRYS